MEHWNPTILLCTVPYILSFPQVASPQTVQEYHVDGNPGVLTIRVNGTQATVCADNYSEMDAKVICRSLGLPDTDARPLRQAYSDKYGPTLLSNLQCVGTETTLDDCPGVKWGVVECPSQQLVRVFCSSAEEGRYRLLSGSSMSAGKVEYYHMGEWGRVDVMSNRFSNKAPEVLCRHLGFPFKSARLIYSSALLRQLMERRPWIKDVKCNGTEISWTECSVTYYPVSGWESRISSDMSVSCEDLRLQRGTHYSGTLEGFYEDKWRKVYQRDFSYQAAVVACKAMGLPRSGALVLGVDEPVSTASPENFLSVGTCYGSEARLTDCTMSRWLTREAGQVRISCEKMDTTGLKFQLVGAPKTSFGRLEVYHDNRWGAVCNTGVGHAEAVVACRTLGFPGDGASVIQNRYLPGGNKDITMNELYCQGNEKNLSQCSFNPFSVGQCYIWEYLVIYCGSSGSLEKNFDLRLVGGGSYFGRVEIYAYGTWYRACDYTRGNRFTAENVCRLQNLPWMNAAQTMCFDEGVGAWWPRRFLCSLSEVETIDECFQSQILQNERCSDLRVICSDTVVDDKNCLQFTLPVWAYVLIVIAAIIILIISCVAIKKRACPKREPPVVDNVPVQSYVVRDEDNFELDIPQPRLSDPPPSYASLFKSEPT